MIKPSAHYRRRDKAGMRWEEDIYLSKIAEQLDQAEVISFDVFDTLLLRTVATPEDIFIEVGKRMQKLFSGRNPFPPEAFAGMRREADARARKMAWELKKAEEITLDDIYHEFHVDSEYVSCAKACELQVERESVYLNPNVVGFLRYCLEHGKKIALISDSYLSKKQLGELLYAAGFDLSLVHILIVSSEHGVLKSGGKLFHVLLDAFKTIPPNRYLHIGDNRRADVDGASSVGMRAAYYGAIPSGVLHPMAMERDYFHCNLGELASLRKLAMHSVPNEYRQGEERALFELGSFVFGTVYAFFAEWILKQAKQEGIHTIITFMREGELLAALIKRAADNQNLDLKISPVYISRRTTELVRLGSVDGSVIDEYLHRPLLKIQELFSIFYMDIEQSPFYQIKALTIEQCKADGSFHQLHTFFKSGPIMEMINENVLRQKALLTRYIQSVTGGEAAITVDIGFRGTMQDCLSRISANGSGRLLHLMLMGIPYNNRFLLDGTPIRGWLGYGGENLDVIEKIYRRIQMPEAVTNADVGTTIAYREEGGMILPVLEPVNIDDAGKRKKLIIWNGIFHFQDCWFMLGEWMGITLDALLGKKKDFLSIFLRILTMPTYEEAAYLGQLYYDESILNSVKATVIKPSDLTAFDQCSSPDDFIDRCDHGMYDEPVYWPEAVIAIRRPSYFCEKYIKTLANARIRKLSRILLDENLRNKRIAVYGAGKMGKELVEIAQSAGLPIACFVDTDTQLHDTYILGIHVLSPEKSLDAADVYIISPVRFEKEIRAKLEELHQKHGEIPHILLYE